MKEIDKIALLYIKAGKILSTLVIQQNLQEKLSQVQKFKK